MKGPGIPRRKGKSRDVMHLWRPERAECGYRYFTAGGAFQHILALVEVERYQQKAPQVTAFGGPQIERGPVQHNQIHQQRAAGVPVVFATVIS